MSMADYQPNLIFLLGHWFLWQGSRIDATPTHCPPFFSSTDFVRVFVSVPTPHVTEHSPGIQPFHTQSILPSIFRNM